MPHEILYTERLGSNGDDFVYVRPADQTAVVRINSSLNPTSQAYNRVLGVLKHVFLPQGYPESVSKDYVNYQIWDTIQAFCSTISNTLTTQAILKGVGVGDNVVSPISAAITWILKDGTGMVARILFAWMSGSGLDAECKKWRLFADVINDVAMFIELCLLPHFPDNALYILCISTSIKAIVGVAGGATRAAITQHQAIKGNTGDVSAKDGSQETCVNLLASLVGVAILSTVGDSFLLWYLFCGMTLLHLYSNYKAVKSLNFLSFNSERLLTMIKLYMFNNMIASPADVNKIESVILGNGLTDKELCGYRIKLGYSLKGLLNGYLLTPQEFKLLANIYKSRMFMLITSIEQKVIYVVFERNYSTIDVVEAYFQAILMGISISCIHKKILNFMKEEPVAENSNSIINKAKNLSKTFENKDGYKRLQIDAAISIDQFATKESSDFINNLRKHGGWSLEQHYIETDKWTGCWSETFTKRS